MPATTKSPANWLTSGPLLLCYKRPVEWPLQALCCDVISLCCFNFLTGTKEDFVLQIAKICLKLPLFSAVLKKKKKIANRLRGFKSA